MNLLVFFILFSIANLFLFLVLRHALLWYRGINEKLAVIEEITSEMKELQDKFSQMNSKTLYKS